MTIIVPVFDGATALRRAAPAVRAQEAARIVYVDDGSRDETPDVLAALADADSRILVVRHEENRGRAAARNTGLQEARGEVVGFLDADVVPEPEWAATCRRALEQTDALAVVGRLRYGGLDPNDPYHQYLASLVRGIRREDAGPIDWRHFLTTAAAVRLDAVRHAGGFPESVEYGEDLALACRLARRGPAGLRFEPTASVTMFEPGDLSSALGKIRQFAGSLPAILDYCPEALSVVGLEALVSTRKVARMGRFLARRRTPARVIRRGLEVLPRPIRPRAVRYLLGHTLLAHAHDALPRAS